jgi:hypothetical protein
MCGQKEILLQIGCLITLAFHGLRCHFSDLQVVKGTLGVDSSFTSAPESDFTLTPLFRLCDPEVSDSLSLESQALRVFPNPQFVGRPDR